MRTVMATIIRMAGRISFNMFLSSGKTDGGDQHVDELDANEGHDDAAEAVDEKIAPQNARRTHRTVGDAAQRQRDERNDDERVEDDCREDGALRRLQLHDVERLELWIEGEKHRGD